MASHLESTAPDSWEIEVWWIWSGGEKLRFNDILTSMFLLYRYVFTLPKLELCSLVQEYAWFSWLYVDCELPISETNWGKNVMLRQMYMCDL